MHQLLHEFSAAFLHDARAASPERRALLVPMPGEQHSFGLIMVAEFFRRAGWDVWDLHPSKPEDLLAAVQKQPFALLGISLSCASRLSELPELIAAVRRRSRNASLGIMVGGQPFLEEPGQVASVGADCTAVDGRRAALEASRLVAALNHPT
jgi:MerR family transcriptional regulator, light-induced transcriptional regulator